MYKNIQKGDVQNLLNELYERKHIDGYLQPFYKNFYDEHKETITVCHGIVKFETEEPEYHIGDLEIAYMQLLKLYEVEEGLRFNRLEEFEKESMPYRRSTK